MSAASAARRVDPALKIVVLEANGYAAYGMCGLPYYLGGVVPSAENLLAYPPETFREDRGLDLRLDTAAVRIDPGRHRVETGQGEQIGYDALVLAAGAQPTRPPIPGIDHDRVFTIRALEDSIRLRTLIDSGSVRRAVIVGAGYIGLEAAEALVAQGIDVEVVEALPHITMSVDSSIADVVEGELRAHVPVRLNTAVTGLRPRADGLTAHLSDGDTVDVDAVVLATGVRPDSRLLTEAGAEHLPGGALVVDDQMHTSIADVFAAGDCVAHQHRVLDAPAWIPLGPAANKTGRVAGTVAAGGHASFPGIVGTAVVKVFDLEVARTGLSSAEAGPDALTCDVVHRSRAKYYPDGHPIHARLVFEPTGRLLGGQLAGRDGVAKRIDVLATALYAGLGLSDLAALDLSYAPPFAPVYDPLLIAAQRAMLTLPAAVS